MGLGAGFVEGDVDGRDVDVGEVQGKLGNAVFLDVPANAFHRLQGAGNADRFTVRIEDGWTGDAVAFFDSACLADVKRDGVRSAA